MPFTELIYSLSKWPLKIILSKYQRVRSVAGVEKNVLVKFKQTFTDDFSNKDRILIAHVARD